MADDHRTITLGAHELAAFRAAVAACTLPDERRHCERLLGQLSSLEAQAATPDARVRFTPGRQTAELALRALEELRAVQRNPRGLRASGD